MRSSDVIFENYSMMSDLPIHVIVNNGRRDAEQYEKQAKDFANASELKQREHRTWAGVAPGWRTHDERLVRSAAPITERVLNVLALRPGLRLLDVACGTGEPPIPAAERVRPGGHVVATEFVEEMLEFAREKAVRRGISNIEFRHADGEQLDVPPSSFDAVSIRWGLMFMPEPVECLRRAHRALKDGGCIAVAPRPGSLRARSQAGWHECLSPHCPHFRTTVLQKTWGNLGNLLFLDSKACSP